MTDSTDLDRARAIFRRARRFYALPLPQPCPVEPRSPRLEPAARLVRTASREALRRPLHDPLPPLRLLP